MPRKKRIFHPLLTSDQFIEKSKSIHGDSLDYSKTIYKGSDYKSVFICKQHDKEYQQVGYSHLKGLVGCPVCKNVNLSMINRKHFSHWLSEFEKRYDGKYTYPKIEEEYAPSVSVRNTVITVVCPDHGEFRLKLGHHLAGSYCPGCVMKKIRRFQSVDEFVAQSREQFGDRFDYSLVREIRTMGDHVDLVCRRHGEFRVTVHNHLKATGGCPKCKMSLGETLIERWLIDHGVEHVKQHFFPDLYHRRRPVTFDFYLPGPRVLIEYDGAQHFNPIPRWGGAQGFEQTRRRDRRRDRYCEAHGFELIRIPYWHRKNIARILSKRFP